MRPSQIQRLNLTAGLRGYIDKLHPKVPLEDSQHKLLEDLLKSSFRKTLNEASKPGPPRLKPKPTVESSSSSTVAAKATKPTEPEFSSLADEHLNKVLSLPIFAPSRPTYDPATSLSRFVNQPLSVFLEHVGTHSVNHQLALHTLSRVIKLHTSSSQEPTTDKPSNHHNPLRALDIVITGLNTQNLLTTSAKDTAFRKITAQCLLLGGRNRRRDLIIHLLTTYTLPVTSNPATSDALFTYTLPSATHEGTLDVFFWQDVLTRMVQRVRTKTNRTAMFRDLVVTWNYATGLRGEELSRRPTLQAPDGTEVGVFDRALEIVEEKMEGTDEVRRGEGGKWPTFKESDKGGSFTAGLRGWVLA